MVTPDTALMVIHDRHQCGPKARGGMASLIGFALAAVFSTPLSTANECWVNKQGLKYAAGYDKDIVPENTEVTWVVVVHSASQGNCALRCLTNRRLMTSHVKNLMKIYI